ncbi:MAG TPA: sigma-70 family RNA polymerase sigma factor [Puia sp.]|nr:sigma-70 family RNA polymerase sigma factor [Puia sp.]
MYKRLALNTSNTDRHVLQRLSEGDKSAFDELFTANYDMVYSAALVMLKSPEIAGDITQDIFLSLWENRQKAVVIENIKGFLYNNVKFIVHKRLRRMKVEDAYARFLKYKEATAIAALEPENLLSATQLQASIQQGIAQLPPQQQRAFRLSREQGLSHVEISEIIGVSRKTVKDYIVRSLAFLRQHLAQHLRLLLLFFV